MGDPRNVAHAKKVSQEKHHKDKHAPKAGPASSRHTKNVQPDKKPASVAESPAKSEVAKPTQPIEPTQLEKSLVVLSKLWWAMEGLNLRPHPCEATGGCPLKADRLLA